MSLKEYTSKRSFESTPEPADSPAKPGKDLRFVVQLHDASHLHYDFRLENKGVLVSWAVPKGPSLKPSDKRLAMMTEDHPYDYQYFEGVIPKGNYGAGQVIVWDNGTFEVGQSKSKAEQEKDFRRGLYQGKVSFRLHGHKLKGEFTLVKKSGAKSDDSNSWLLIKKQDKHASKSDITKQDHSVISDQTVDEVNQSDNFSWQQWSDQIDQYELPKQNIKRPIKPMLATLVDQAFSDDDWLFELKWDGYRAIAETGHKVKLYSRNHKDFASDYPDIAEELTSIHQAAVLDGEVVMLKDDGRPDFNALQNYQPGKGTAPVYYTFDLLWLDGYDLTGAPLTLRKKLLRRILPESSLLRYSDHIVGRGEDLLQLATARNLEGVMAKRADSHYQPGRRSQQWLKLKCQKRQEAVIGGYTEPRGSRKGIGALVLGVYDNDKLRYIGHSGGGLSNKQLLDIQQKLQKIETPDSPFATKPKTNAPAHWVKPELLCEVAFSEWTPGGHMRHPKIIGLREDKPARQVGREKPRATQQAIETPGFEITHRDKVFWPKTKTTKGDLIDYYQTMSQYILPYVQDRPMTLLRHPNGATKPGFFQKDINQPLPDDMQTFCRYSESNKKDINYFVCQDEPSLLYMAQLGCIEINPWNSTIHHSDKPDWLVLDLDPEDIGFTKVVEVARTIKKLLDELAIASFIKTSGKTGLHIYLPLHAKYDYDQTKQFAEILAREANRRLPKITSVERSPAKRQGRVYLDFLQNRVGQTLAAPYSVRPTPDATVSMPLTWSQVTKRLKPTNFTLQNAPGIVAKRKDPWAKFTKSQVVIEDVLPKLGG